MRAQAAKRRSDRTATPAGFKLGQAFRRMDGLGSHAEGLAAPQAREMPDFCNIWRNAHFTIVNFLVFDLDT